MELATAIELRDAAKTAYRDALAARTAGFGDKTVTRQDITSLRREFESWERVVANLQRGELPIAIATWS